jgi:hypothetical protein
MPRFVGSLVIAVGLSSLLASTPLEGQACVGEPLRDGQIGIQGVVDLAPDATGLGARISVNVPGPVAASLEAARASVDDGFGTSSSSVEVSGSIDLPTEAVSICGFTGFGYGREHGSLFGLSATSSGILIPLGIGIGRPFGSRSLTLSPYAQPQLLYGRTHVRVTGPDGERPFASNSDWAKGLELGLRIIRRHVFCGAAARLTWIENSATIYRLLCGMTIGGR